MPEQLLTGISLNHKMNIIIEPDPEMQLLLLRQELAVEVPLQVLEVHPEVLSVIRILPG